VTPHTVAEHLAHLRHAGALDGADHVGEASGGQRLLVRVGLWLDGAGRVARARYRATTCAALIAYAEAACALAEERGGGALGPERLRRMVRGVHPVHRARADLVALALARALASAPRRTQERA
jgi:hypothetical protein